MPPTRALVCVCVCVYVSVCVRVHMLSSIQLSASAVSDSLQPHGPPGSSVHGVLQTRMLEWVAISFSISMLKGSFNTIMRPM